MKALVMIAVWGAVGFAMGRVTTPARTIVVAATPAVTTPPVSSTRPTLRAVAPPKLSVDDVEQPIAGTPLPPPKLVTDAGVLRGTIRDARGERLDGVTIIFSEGPDAPEAVLTDEHGEYRTKSLATGYYLMTLYYGEATVEKKNVFVSDVTSTMYDGEIPDVPQRPELIVDPPPPEAPPLDGDLYIRQVPPTRTFEAVIGAAAGSQPEPGTGAME
ncbi:MAG: carboxypeptidase-like regulatory domain-containing protein [Kofleriaceae bacterium]